MGYLVATSGRIRLPEELENQALTVLEVELAPREGWFDADQPVDDLAELARSVGADATRDGDWLVLTTDRQGDPTWSDQATAFYSGLARFVTEGEVRLRGEDGAQWAYRYSPEGMTTAGTSGWQGATPPAPAAASPQRPVTPATPAMPTEPPTAPPAPPATSPGPTSAGDEPAAVELPPDQASAPPCPPGSPAGEPEPPSADSPSWPPAPLPVQPPAQPRPPVEEFRWEPGQDAGPPPADTQFWSEEPTAPRSTARTVGMALLLVVGVILLVGVASLAAGMAG